MKIMTREEFEKENGKQVIENVYKLAELAWTLGITIKEIKLERNFYQDLPFGEKVFADPPDIAMISTDYMDIKVSK